MASPGSDVLFEEPTVKKAYMIGGVPIIFPYKAYPSQITMMDKIVKCLNKKQNCLLESPTGSGKSLALLCASIAWLRKTEKDINEAETALTNYLNSHGIEKNISCVDCCEQPCFDKPKIDIKKFAFPNYNRLKNYEIHDKNVGQATNCLTQNDNLLDLTSHRGNDASGSNPSNAIFDTDKDSKLKSESPHDDNQIQKRGIVFIDDDDFEDFQPVKKNKLFNNARSVSEDKKQSMNSDFPMQDKSIPTSSGDNNILEYSTSDAGMPKPKSVLGTEENNLPAKLPKIYFGTRTHKQIGQIIRELKKTPYKDIKMTILSSRERTCIHPKNCKSHNKNEGCDELIKKEEGPSCNFYKNVKRLSYYQPIEMSTAFDLEDFVSLCRRKQICPYFGAREILPFSEIVFCPYNYLVDPLIRSAMSITLKNNIIIMDEAHNIEDFAREAASSKLSVHQLQEAIADVLQIGQSKELDTEPYMHIGKVLENLKKWLESSQNLTDYVTFDSSCKVWSGDEMIACLDYVGLGPDTFPVFQSKYSQICRDESEAEKEKTAEFQTLKLSGSTHMCLKSLTETLNYLYKDKLIYVGDYRCVVMKSKTYSDDKRIVLSHSKRMSFTKLDFEITLNFWCLNPAVAFSDMKGVHSIVVASGTLAPLTSFQSELGIPFQINLEANHVIRKDQIWVGTIGRGPSNNSLTATYHNAATFSFQDDIGNIICQICSVIPHGILCFLPSYGLLDKLVSRWQLTGLWNKLESKKTVLCEPRRANEDFRQVIQDFYDAIDNSETGNAYVGNGAILFAVCRGKVSEGIDFPDNYARAVITVGIPFPNVKDAQVDLKKRYNDIHSSKRQIVTGNAWYEMQAFRALNQALGRCIRHRNDFGALIMIDERFQKNMRYIDALSKWLRTEIRHYSTFHDALNSLNEFARRVGLKNQIEIEL